MSALTKNKGMFVINKKWYERTVRFFKENKAARTVLFFTYKILPYVLFVAYPVMLVVEFFILGFCWEWAKLAVIPFATLVLATVMRLVINEQRPYEKYGIESVFGKKTEGNSMPSRHSVSAVVIAMAFLYVNPVLGIIAMAIAFLIVMSRIHAGAHFLRDVLVGVIIGLAAGQLFWVI